MKKLIALCLVAIGLSVTSCADRKLTAEEKNQASTNEIMSDLGKSQPIPKVGYSQTRASLIKILELESRITSTWTVERAMDGRVLTVFPSIGYPIPGGTSLTNPQQLTCQYYRLSGSGYSCGAIGQAEPTGVFVPATSKGTRVIQVLPDGSKVVFYSESKLSTYAYPIKQVGEYKIEPAGSAPETSKIEFKNSISSPSSK